MRLKTLFSAVLALLGLIVSVAVGWAGAALWWPDMPGAKDLPPIAASLPFEVRWWALALMLLGGAGVLSVLPAPPWTRMRRAPKQAAPQIELAPALCSIEDRPSDEPEA